MHMRIAFQRAIEENTPNPPMQHKAGGQSEQVSNTCSFLFDKSFQLALAWLVQEGS